ncbi:MAG: pyridoxamine 5'-phosphate oxidase family protein [Chloroflexi bacterium]|nr:pyridoxamine 5'-phosphate oxidase family protein [Chloroflexota bacterium]
MAEQLSDEEILAAATELAAGQVGGTLATVHAEDATPYVTYVLFHLRANGEVLFGSGASPQHSRNMIATPEVSFLIDNRDMVTTDWTKFDRVVIEGRSVLVGREDERYHDYVAELAAKNQMAAFFTEHGSLFVIQPRRLILMKGLDPVRHTVDFDW